MTKRFLGFRGLIVLLVAAVTTPATAELNIRTGGFVVEHSVDLRAAPNAVWWALIDPAKWWDGSHSYSGNPANFSLETIAGGCFCENWGEGSVQHLTVTRIQTGRSLRLTGALGPLLDLGANGAMAFDVEPNGSGGTTLRHRYAVSGFDLEAVAPAVHAVQVTQVERLAAFVRTGSPELPAPIAIPTPTPAPVVQPEQATPAAAAVPQGVSPAPVSGAAGVAVPQARVEPGSVSRY